MIEKNKEYGVVYTPEWIVDLIFRNLLQKYTPTLKVCDPSCGTGAFLVRLVERICDTVPTKDCRKALENIAGLDIDAKALSACEKRLDAVLVAKGNRLKIKWNLHHIDSTNRTSLTPYKEHFDFVVGNPPYVRIQHLGETRRKQLQQDWALTQCGSTDLYIAFFEIGMYLLKRGGRLGYITPNTFTKTAAGQSLRRFILERHGIACLIDFGAHQIFKDATTYSLITVLNKDKKCKEFSLYRYDGQCVVSKGRVPISHLPISDIWILESEETLQKIENIRNRGRPLGEIADIHVGIQTLADNVFILESIQANPDIVVAIDMHGREVCLEAAVTRPILKASVMKNGRDIKNRIVIFPYENGTLLLEKTFMEKFPETYGYLTKHKELLLARDKGKFNADRWYAFGREFGLFTTFGDKILTSGMNKKPNFQVCRSPKYTFYAGYCVKPKAGISIKDLLPVLNSEEMDFYIRRTSRDYQSGWKSYAKSFIRNYGIPANVTGCIANNQTSVFK